MLSSSCYKWSSWNQASSFKGKTIFADNLQNVENSVQRYRLTFATAWFLKSDPRRPTSFLLQVEPSRSLSTACLYPGSGANVLSRVSELWASGDTCSRLDWLDIAYVTLRRDGSTDFPWSSSPVRSLVRRICSRRCLEEDQQQVRQTYRFKSQTIDQSARTFSQKLLFSTPRMKRGLTIVDDRWIVLRQGMNNGYLQRTDNLSTVIPLLIGRTRLPRSDRPTPVHISVAF